MSIASQAKVRRRTPFSLAVAAVAFGAAIAAAQTPAPQPPGLPAPANSSAPPAAAPGFITAFGRWVQQGVATMGAGFGSMVGVIGGHAGDTARGMTDGASTVAKGAADVARDTATTVTRLPATAFISGREQCLPAPNGAPDCRAAAEAMCRTRGYNGGNSIDFETAERCPPPYRVSSRNTPEGVCTMEHFVTRALCQ